MQWTFDRVVNIITAAGTIGPFIWTVTLYRRELGRRAAADKVARRHQASQVTGWIEPRLGIDEQPNRGRLVLRNVSSLPVRSVAIHVIDYEGDLFVESIGFVPPETTVENLPARFGLTLKYPGETMPLAFSFADADGNLWFRDWEGGLREWPRDGNPDWYLPMVELWRPTWAPDAQPQKH
jgi:hypothetical protein